ncbi:DUF3426 domain-containing protein [Desulfoluna butyratoxydans]|uniref:Zinc finger/thioredoxin putative n=1 Tax=Desulfoluna butyratoxydans TaxID=231438 RepID=A0A4U8YQL5_9BACT|nr:DUF3426 domain-containing protein [Desulfoluna butyratoxydans]VFQ43533.1 zinc finger/thioredoxin putative [Desulfoluna butyratoxydans]
MIITCQECDSRFVLDDKLIKPTGSKVRCSSCKHVFKVFSETAAPSVEEPPQAPPAEAPAAPAPRNLDEGDDLQSELNRELDRLFGLEEDEPGEEAAPDAATPPAEAPAPEPVAEEAPAESIDDIDLDDLGLGDLDLQASPDMGMPDDLDLSEFDLADLDLDLSLDEGPAPAAPAEGSEVEETLDFSGLEESLAGLEPEAPGQEDSGFADVSLSLDDEGTVDAPVFDDDLDFSDLEAALGAPDGDTAKEPAAPEEEFDFSEMALSLDGGGSDVELVGDAESPAFSAGDGDAAALSMGGLGELELSLDDGPVDAAKGTAEAHTDAEDGFMELDLDLDLGDEEPLQASLESSLDEELDLSELEGLLQEEPAAGEDRPEDDDIELELDFDFKGDEKTQEFDPLEKDTLEDSDFSDIEAMLEKDDTPLDVEADVNGEVDLELELDLAPEAEEAVAAVPVSAPVAPAPEPVAEAVRIDEPEPEPEPEAPAKASRSHARDGGRGSGLRIFLTILLVVVLLFAILVGVYAMRDEIQDRTGVAIPTINAVEKARETLSGLGIPLVSDWVKPAEKDPDGTRHLLTQDVTGRFVVSPSLGDLFVITGKVRNNYGTTRHSIQLLGQLYTKENLEVQSKEFYAGNAMTDAELATLSMEEIDQRLKTTLGKDNINARVSPGQLVPFMVVFEKLPDDLTEFAVVVKGSREGAAIK